MTDEQRWKIVRKLLGYVEDGSHESVTISQDDATRTWCVQIGQIGRLTFYDDSLDRALTEAEKGHQ